MVNAENDGAVNRFKAVTYAIDIYNKYSGYLLVVFLVVIGYFQQSKTAKIHQVFIEIEKIAKKSLKIGIENLFTMR